MASPATAVVLFLANNTERILNKSYHGGPTNIMLWQRFTGSPGHYGLIGVLAFAVAVGAVSWALVKGRRHRRTPPKDRFGGKGLGDSIRRQALAREIARLDAAYRAGEVAAEEYGHLRPSLKRRLMEAITGDLAEGGKGR